MDIEYFYLNKPLDEPEFLKVSIKIIPQEIIYEYKLLEILDEDD